VTLDMPLQLHRAGRERPLEPKEGGNASFYAETRECERAGLRAEGGGVGASTAAQCLNV